MRYVKFLHLYQMMSSKQEDLINETFEKISKVGYVEKTEYLHGETGNLKEIIIEYEATEKI